MGSSSINLSQCGNYFLPAWFENSRNWFGYRFYIIGMFCCCHTCQTLLPSKKYQQRQGRDHQPSHPHPLPPGTIRPEKHHNCQTLNNNNNNNNNNKTSLWYKSSTKTSSCCFRTKPVSNRSHTEKDWYCCWDLQIYVIIGKIYCRDYSNIIFFDRLETWGDIWSPSSRPIDQLSHLVESHQQYPKNIHTWPP